MNSLLAALALLPLDALAGPPVVPPAGQIGALDFGVTCQVPLFGNRTFQGYYRATAPIQASSGSEIYFTEVTAQVVVPHTITAAASLLNVTSASANVNVSLLLENATPEVYHVFPHGLDVNDIAVVANKSLVVNVPPKGTLPPLGPITLGEAGKVHTIHLGQVDLSVNLYYGPNNTGVFGPIPIHCPPGNISYDLGIVDITPAVPGAKPWNYTTKGQYTFLDIGNNQETGSFRYPYTCNLGNVTEDVDLEITGIVPAYLHPNTSVPIQKVSGYLRVPEKNLPAFESASAVRVTASSFTLEVENGSPAALNVLKQPLSTELEYKTGQDVQLTLPTAGTFDVEGVVSGQPGRELYLGLGNTTAVVEFLDGQGTRVGALDAKCGPKFGAKVIGIPVTTETPPPIDE